MRRSDSKAAERWKPASSSGLAIPGLAALICALGVAGAAAARPPSLVGKWRLNLNESELLQGDEPPAELVMAITQDDEKGFRWTVTVTMKNGEGGATSFVGAIDGKPHPIMGRPGSTSAFSWTGEGALKQVSESAGGIAVETCAVAPDLRRLTCEARQTDRTGRAAGYVEVFDRLDAPRPAP